MSTDVKDTILTGLMMFVILFFGVLPFGILGWIDGSKERTPTMDRYSFNVGAWCALQATGNREMDAATRQAIDDCRRTNGWLELSPIPK